MNKNLIKMTAAALAAALLMNTGAFAYAAENTGASPWENTNISGNLPDEQPSEKDDFYASANYQWLTENQAGFLSASSTLDDTDHGITERLQALIQDSSCDSSLLQKVRILYDQLMDTEAKDQAGMEPIQPYLDQINQVTTLEELSQLLADKDFPFSFFVQTYVAPRYMDCKNAVVLEPQLLITSYEDETYTDYQDDFDADNITTWGINILSGELVAAMNALSLGEDLFHLPTLLGNLVRFESQYGSKILTMDSYNEAERGTLDSLTQDFTLEELQSFCGSFPIQAILEKEGRDQSESYTVEGAEWLQALTESYTEENLETLKEWVKLKLLAEVSPYITLDSIQMPDWLTSLLGTEDDDSDTDSDTDTEASVSSLIQDAISFVAGDDLSEEVTDQLVSAVEENNQASVMEALMDSKTFGHALAALDTEYNICEEDIERLTAFTKDLLQTYSQVIAKEDWMEEETKSAIQDKLDHMTLNILQPSDGYLSYDDLELIPTEEGGTLFENYLILRKYVQDQITKKINQEPISTYTWYMYSPTICNAFYDANTNSINIFPGIINDSTYRSDMSDEEMYGAIGVIIGHEISHAFDNLGSQFDAEGHPVNWFTGDDMEQYLDRLQKVQDYYDSITISDGVSVDGAKVLGEACADLCAVDIVLELAKEKENFDYDTFFRSFANVFAASYSGFYMDLLTEMDTHPTAYLRINVNLQQFQEFYDTYQVTEGDGMYLAEEDRLNIL